jgi:hypothetical protein
MPLRFTLNPFIFELNDAAFALQIEDLLLPECSDPLHKLAVHGFIMDLSNIDNYKKTKAKSY